MAEIRTYAEQCPVGGPIIHLGATSMDVLDNVDALRLRSGLGLILQRLESLLKTLVTRMEAEAHTPAIAFTHIQPAEPTTVGYRLAQYAQDLFMDWQELANLKIQGKGLKGAVGTSASYTQLLADSPMSAQQLESRVMEQLGLSAFPVATQTYPRKQDWLILNGLAGLCGSLHKFAFDLRILQSPPIGEWSEPFGANINSLTRLVAALPKVAWDNAALNLLERTLDDSGNRRFTLPEAFLVTDEVLIRVERLIEGLNIWPGPTARNLRDYGLFAATERLLMEAVKAGGDRQELHEVIREHSLTAWQALQEGLTNPLAKLLAEDPRINGLVDEQNIPALLEAVDHVGDAPERTLELAAQICAEIT